MKYTIERSDNIEGDKRFKVPFKIIWRCPNCGTKLEVDYANGGHYFSYPIIPGVQEVTLHCIECDHEEGPIPMRLDITLTPVVAGEADDEG